MRHRQRQFTSSLAIVLAVVALLGGCATNQTQVRSAGDAVQQSEVQEHRLDLPGEADRVYLELDFEAEGGGVSWRLTDPLGEGREQGEVGPGDELDRDVDFDPIVGRWVLSLAFDQFSGTYDARLAGRW